MIKFLHFNNHHLIRSSKRAQKQFQSRTVAAKVADPAVIRQLATDFITTDPVNQMLIYTLNVGVALVHPKDKYHKEIGRNESKAKMEDIPLKVVAVNITPTHIFVRLQTFKSMDLNLRLNKQTNFSTITGTMSGDY